MPSVKWIFPFSDLGESFDLSMNVHEKKVSDGDGSKKLSVLTSRLTSTGPDLAYIIWCDMICHSIGEFRFEDPILLIDKDSFHEHQGFGLMTFEEAKRIKAVDFPPKMEVTLKFRIYQEGSRPPVFHPNGWNLPILLRQVENCLDDPQFSDVKIKTQEGKTYHAHGLVLSLRSPIFGKCIKKGQKKIHLDVSNATMDVLLDFIYKDEFEEENASVDLLKVTAKYKIDRLTCVVSECLCRGLTLESVLDTFAVAHDIGDDELMRQCEAFLADHDIRFILNGEKIKLLPKEVQSRIRFLKKEKKALYNPPTESESE